MSSLLHINLPALVMTAGYLGLFCIVCAESGLFFGFFFPGDSLLFTAGLLSSQGYLNIWILLPLFSCAAILGDSIGYWFGSRAGAALFGREDSLLFHKRYLERTREFFETYGSRAVVVSRFVPVVRTFAPIFAGIGHMQYRRFLAYNIVGGVAWSFGFTIAGYFLGASFPWLQGYLLYISLGIIVLSVAPLLWELGRKHLG